MKLIDDFLNGITMYRLVLYVLIFFVGVAEVLSFFKLLPFNPLNLFFSTLLLVVVCWLTNKIFAAVFEVPANVESLYITALILALILTPASSLGQLQFFFWAGVLAMASKYIFALGKKHLFNPAALAVFVTALTLNYSASWWIGSTWMMPFVAVGGLLIVKKIRRFDFVFAFLLTALTVILVSSAIKGSDLLTVAQKLILDTPLLFFAFIMLTEPLTTPPTVFWQMIYGTLVGILFAPFIHIGSFYFTPEVALLAGNIFSFFVSPKDKLLLTLKEKIQLAPDIYDFVFGLDKKFVSLPGQYMEWTLGHSKPDSRGNRRYFTLASSPAEENLRIGVKFYPNGSSFKSKLLSMQAGDKIVASQLAGEFVLPKDPLKKLCFIAGGIGVTPYRSIIKYLLDTNQKRDIILLYSSKKEYDFVYRDIFSEASERLGVKTFFVTTEKGEIIDQAMIEHEVPDYKERIFYISGPHGMVDAFKKTCKEMGIPDSQIKVDFFPGYA